MQFSENQKYYLKRFAALHMPEIDRMPSVQDGPAIRKDRREVSQGKAVS